MVYYIDPIELLLLSSPYFIKIDLTKSKNHLGALGETNIFLINISRETGT